MIGTMIMLITTFIIIKGLLLYFILKNNNYNELSKETTEKEIIEEIAKRIVKRYTTHLFLEAIEFDVEQENNNKKED